MSFNNKSKTFNNGLDNDDEYEFTIASVSTSAPGVEIVARTDKSTHLTPLAETEAGTVNGYWLQNVFSGDEIDLSVNISNDVEDEDDDTFVQASQNVFFGISKKKAVFGLSCAAMMIVASFAVVGIIGASKNSRISSSAAVVATAKSSKGPKAKSSKAPKAGGYYEYRYEDFCRDFANEYFPMVFFLSNSSMAVNDPHGYCVEKCGKCIFEEDMVPEGMFRGIVHEAFILYPSPPFNFTQCGCHYDALVHADTSVDFACAYNDPEFDGHWNYSNIIGTGPMRRTLPPVSPEIGAPSSIVLSSEGGRLWSQPVSGMVKVASQEERSEEDLLSCYQWIEYGSTFAPTPTPTSAAPTITVVPTY